ncbi:MAG: hypothetical protein FWH49_06915 [Clostridiales bacterium]|nr:hypothetical protein [Clostridiales bacterium]
MKLNHYMAFLRVTIDEHEEGEIAGYVYSRRLKEPIYFHDAANLLLQIEDLLDRQDFPRAFQKKRTFRRTDQKSISSAPEKDEEEEYEEEAEDQGKSGNMTEEEVNQAEGKIATFAMNVITRQNTSWQGFLDWLDGSPRIAFNSDLELLSMVREHLNL